MSSITHIQSNTVGIFHYTLRDDSGAILDSSNGSSPMAYLHGAGNIVPGLERALEGKTTGDKFQVAVPPEDGYGLPVQAEPWVVPASQLPQGAAVGMHLTLQSEDGRRRTAWIKDLSATEASLTFDHPLAGKTLNFEVEVMGVRAATPDEKQHGHAHGPDGHAHHHHGHAPGNHRGGGGRRSLARRDSDKKKGKKKK